MKPIAAANVRVRTYRLLRPQSPAYPTMLERALNEMPDSSVVAKDRLKPKVWVRPPSPAREKLKPNEAVPGSPITRGVP